MIHMTKKKYIVNQEDKDKIMKLYDAGKSMEEIGRLCGFTHNAVKIIIKNETGEYTERKKPNIKVEEVCAPKKIKRESYASQRERVIHLFKGGCTINEIILKLKALTRTEIQDILLEEKLIAPKDADGRKSVRVDDIEDTIRNCNIGDKYRLSHINHNITVTIQQKYNRYVMTDKGSFTYKELLLGTKLD